jgi:hypothetical protein
VQCAGEDEARSRVAELKPLRKWPVYFFASDTTGEKDFEEFYTDTETLDMDRFQNLGVIKNQPTFDQARLERFETRIRSLRSAGSWSRSDLMDLFNQMIPGFNHKETGKFLDGRM